MKKRASYPSNLERRGRRRRSFGRRRDGNLGRDSRRSRAIGEGRLAVAAGADAEDGKEIVVAEGRWRRRRRNRVVDRKGKRKEWIEGGCGWASTEKGGGLEMARTSRTLAEFHFLRRCLIFWLW